MHISNTINMTQKKILVDTHCHINIMIKETFDVPLTEQEIISAQLIINEASKHHVTTIINVGTSVMESKNCVNLSLAYPNLYATIGIHPTDATPHWKQELTELMIILKNDHKKKIVGIGECGIDLYHKPHNLVLQKDLFKAQIEWSLEKNLALIIHSRNASHETLMILDEYSNDIKRATMHCFSYDLSIAQELIKKGYMLGIDAPITYPKNNELRIIAQTIPLSHIILETDAPFLPPQKERGKKNHPLHIATIAQYIAELRNETFEHIAAQTTKNAFTLFGLPQEN